MFYPNKPQYDQHTPFSEQIDRGDFKFKRTLRDEKNGDIYQAEIRVKKARKRKGSGGGGGPSSLEAKMRAQIDEYFDEMKRQALKFKQKGIERERAAWMKQSSCNGFRDKIDRTSKKFKDLHSNCNHYRNRLEEFNRDCKDMRVPQEFIEEAIQRSMKLRGRNSPNVSKREREFKEVKFEQEALNKGDYSNEYGRNQTMPTLSRSRSDRDYNQGSQNFQNSQREFSPAYDEYTPIVKNPIKKAGVFGSMSEDEIEELITDMEKEIESLKHEVWITQKKYKKLKKQNPQNNNFERSDSLYSTQGSNQNSYLSSSNVPLLKNASNVENGFFKKLKNHLESVEYLLQEMSEELKFDPASYKGPFLSKSSNHSPLEGDNDDDEDSELEADLSKMTKKVMIRNSSFQRRLRPLCKLNTDKFRGGSETIEEKLHEESAQTEHKESGQQRLIELEDQQKQISNLVLFFNENLSKIDALNFKIPPLTFSITYLDNLLDLSSLRIQQLMKANQEQVNVIQSQSFQLKEANLKNSSLQNENLQSNKEYEIINKMVKNESMKNPTALITSIKQLLEEKEFNSKKCENLNSQLLKLSSVVRDRQEEISTLQNRLSVSQDQLLRFQVKEQNDAQISGILQNSNDHIDSILEENKHLKEKQEEVQQSLQQYEKLLDSGNAKPFKGSNNTPNLRNNLEVIVDDINRMINFEDRGSSTGGEICKFSVSAEKSIRRVFGEDTAWLVLNYEKVIGIFRSKGSLVEEIFKERVIFFLLFFYC